MPLSQDIIDAVVDENVKVGAGHPAQLLNHSHQNLIHHQQIAQASLVAAHQNQLNSSNLLYNEWGRRLIENTAEEAKSTTEILSGHAQSFNLSSLAAGIAAAMMVLNSAGRTGAGVQAGGTVG